MLKKKDSIGQRKRKKKSQRTKVKFVTATKWQCAEPFKFSSECKRKRKHELIFLMIMKK